MQQIDVERPGRPLVLVADDDPSIRALVASLLDDEGFACTGIGDGERLMHMLASVIPAAVVLDIQMPVLDGYGVMARLQAEPALREIPVVAISANADRQRLIAAGCRTFVPKPFDLDDLLVALRGAMASHAPLGQSLQG